MTTDSGSYDDATLQRRAAMAQAMMGQRQKPITHWAEGLSELGNGFLGGYQLAQLDKERKAEKTAEKNELYTAAGLPAPAAPAASPSGFQKIASLLSGGGADAPASPAAPAAMPSAPMSPAAPQAATSGKIYSNDEPSPLDPPSGQDRMRMMATILGESANQPAAGQNAVASVIRNRAVAGNYGGDTPSGVVTAKNQFEPWNTESGRSKMAAMMTNPALAAKADQAIALAYGEGGQAPNDPTNGAKNFIEPKLQTALGRPMPAWAQGPGQMIGDHKFIGGAPQDPSQQPYQVAGPSTAAPQAPVAQAMTPPQMPASAPTGMFANVPKEQLPGILSGLTSKNPTLKAIAVQQLGNFTKADAPTDETKEYKLAQSQGYKGTFVDFKTDIKKAGKPETTVNVGGGSDKQIFDTMDESTKAARTTAAGLTGLREARNAINGGAFTGAGANQLLGMQKIGAALGLANSDKIVNTETFRSAIAPQVAAVLKSTVGTANISNSDREFAEKAAGGNITLDEKSITRLLDIMERASTAQLEGHQKRLEAVYGDPEKYKRERALFGVDMPAAPPMAAPASAAAPAAPDRGAIEAEMKRRGLLK